jgi:type IV pilus assembly protein PilC
MAGNLRQFQYRGVKRGRRMKGRIEAEHPGDARKKLRGNGLRDLRIKEIKPKKPSSLAINITWGPFGRIPQKEIVIFSKKLATMIRSGLPIVDTLGLIVDQTKNHNLKAVVQNMADRLNTGASLSQAFREHTRHFDTVYINMVEAGELSGRLDGFLDRLVEMLEKQQKIRAGIKSALFYPVTLIVITLLISYGMLTKVVPIFQEMYEGLGAQLPGPTQRIVDASDWIRDGGNMLSLITVVAGIWLTNRLLSTYIRQYRKGKSYLMLRVPLFGDIMTKSTVARLSLLMANLLAAGVGVIETLEVSRTVTKNLMFQDAATRIRDNLSTGAELSVLFKEEPVFPLALSQMLAVGERTGNMDEMLISIARYYEEEFDSVVEGLSSVIEPLMIVFVGAMIGVMVVALYLPIFSAGDAFT